MLSRIEHASNQDVAQHANPVCEKLLHFDILAIL